MTAPNSFHSSNPTVRVRTERVIDLGGRAIHVFQFPVPPATAYHYFADIPAVFQLLPDTLDVHSYANDCYRLIVGATDGHGHSMSAVFDMNAEGDYGHHIRLSPALSSPELPRKGMVFRGDLWAEALFTPTAHGTSVEYTVEIAMSIPIPGVLRLMPQSFLQTLGERAMSFKMTQMISGFARDIEADFASWRAKS